MAEDILQLLFESYSGSTLSEKTELPTSGSHRRYYRLKGGNISIIGVQGTDFDENNAFITLSRHFKEKGINVPTVLAVSEDGMCYIQEDLGDKMLFDQLSQGRESGRYNSYETNLLCRTIEKLPKLQFKGAEGLDWSVCYPQKEFDGRMVDFDLNYFKYCFLKATGLEFNEIQLQDDFEKLKADLKKVWNSRGGRENLWEMVPLKIMRKNYRPEIRECRPTDITEIDTFVELIAADPDYAEYPGHEEFSGQPAANGQKAAGR